MEVAFMHLADCGNVTDTGKLNIIGIFDRIHVPTFPFQHPSMTLVIKLQADRAERGRKCAINIKLIGPDGEEVLSLPPLKVTVPRPPQSQPGPITMNQLINMGGVQFNRAGPHEFAVLVDNDQKGSLSFEVQQALQRP